MNTELSFRQGFVGKYQEVKLPNLIRHSVNSYVEKQLKTVTKNRDTFCKNTKVII